MMRYLVTALLGALVMTALWGRYEANRAEGWRDYAHRLERASRAAAAATKTLREREAAQAKEKADVAQRDYRATVAAVRSATDRHVAANRVRSASSVSGTLPVDQAGAAPICANVPDGAVLASEADMRAAAEWQAYGLALREWALSVTQ